MSCKVAIVGASSLAGREILKTLSDRSFPLTKIRLFETEHSVGQYLSYQTEDILIEEISEHVLREEKFKFVFFAGGYQLSQKFLPIAQSANSYIIDLSSYSHHHLSSILSVPAIQFNENSNNIYTNPSCLSIQLAMVLYPLNKIVPIQRVIGSSYQSVSGAGFFGVEELERQAHEISNGKEASVHYFDKQISFNVIPCVDPCLENGWSKEEDLVCQELGELLGNRELDISLTCVRVPVLRGHGISLTIELEKELSLEKMISLWEEKGYCVSDDNLTPWEMENTIDIGICRLRKDRKNPKCYHLWTVADNLSIGMSLNPVSIAEHLL